MILKDSSIEYSGSKGVPHVVHKEGQGEKRRVGEWRIFKPVMHHPKCSACGLCWAVCPDSAISLAADGKPIVNYALCKGCLICWQSCPSQAAIAKVRDTHMEE